MSEFLIESHRPQLVELPLRLMLTSFPAKGVRESRKVYTRALQRGPHTYTMTLTNICPTGTERWSRWVDKDLIPSAGSGRNFHAMLLGDAKRKMLKHGDAGRNLLYPSLTDITERLALRKDSRNNERIEDLFVAFSFLNMIYEVNGKKVNVESRADDEELTGTKFTRFADSVFDWTRRGRLVSAGITVSREWLETMGRRTATVKEEVYMKMRGPGIKDLYGVIGYQSRTAAAKKIPTYVSTFEDIFRQIEDTPTNNYNRSERKRNIISWVKEICESDPSIEAEFDSSKMILTVWARDPKQVERDQEDDTQIPVPVPAPVQQSSEINGRDPEEERAILETEQFMLNFPSTIGREARR